MKLSVLITTVCILFGCMACTAPQFDKDAVAQQIAKVNEKFTQAMTAGDAETLASLYTDDATLMPPNSESLSGKDAIKEWVGNASGMGIKDFTLTTTELSGSGNWAYEVGTYSMEIGGTQDTGKYIVVWQKQADGSWKLHKDIWNSNTPLPAPEMSNK